VSGPDPSDEAAGNYTQQDLAGWGIGMANELNVNTSDLRAAAASSDAAASVLTGTGTGTTLGSRSSGIGIAALDMAISSVRGRQSTRMSGHADSMRGGGQRYDDTDGGSAENIAVTV
jgi:hypothetical protein